MTASGSGRLRKPREQQLIDPSEVESMNQAANTASDASPDGCTPQFTWTGRGDDDWVLERTLDAYEVEELDGHDLARFFQG